MPEEGFLRRWARVKASGAEVVAEAPPRPAAPPAPVAPPAAVAPSLEPGVAEQAEPRPAPTLFDAARLTPDSDFSAFVSPNVAQDVRRLALKKLFADPHFNVMDKLDMYMDDYNKPDPVSAAMLAGLQHARSTLRRPEEVQAELARLAALDPPAHAAGVVQAVPGELAPAQDEEAPLAAHAEAEAESGPDASSPVPDEHIPTNDPAATLPGEEPVLAADPAAIEHRSGDDSDAIAQTIVRAHNVVTPP